METQKNTDHGEVFFMMKREISTVPNLQLITHQVAGRPVRLFMKDVLKKMNL